MNDITSFVPRPAAPARPAHRAQPATDSPARDLPARKRSTKTLAALSLAAAVAAPVALTAIAKLRAAQPPTIGAQQPTLSPADALRQGIQLYRNGQYEES